MNDFELFVNFGAVVEIRRNYKDDLYNFCKLMIEVGTYNEAITYFINAMGLIEELKNGKWEKMKLANNLSIQSKLELLQEGFTDDYFWHIIDINKGMKNRICIEYQTYNGFTFGNKEDYINYDDTIKVLSVNDLIFASNRAEEFKLKYDETSFMKELDKKDEELAINITDFCEWYEWQLVKYSNGLYNILDLQTEEFLYEENVELQECIERTFFRMVDYFTDEQEHEDIDYMKKELETYIKLGKKYDFYDDDNIKWLQDWLIEEIEYLKD